ncbi:MAG: NYN domain-containing protein [Dehalococcoidia bacterium]|nr:NYN domain-containing protein [Dehalococcoidia bacterium]
MVEPTTRGDDVALFIDWENFKISLAAGNRGPNLSSLREEVSNQGRVVVAKAYADWVTHAPELRGASQFNNDPPSLYAAGIEPVFVPTRIPSTQASTANGMRTYRVKNSVDVKMTADCIECAHSYPNIGTFVLVSGDSDFLHVVNALRTMGKRVVIIGVSWSTSRRLADQVDSLLLYDKDVDPLAPQPAVLPQHAPRREAQNDVPELAEVIRAIEEIIRDERNAGGNPLLTSIKQRLMRRYPSFDEKKLGFSGFKKLMARTAEEGNIKLIHAGLVDWAIMAEEETPEGTTEEIPSGVASKPSRRRGGRRRHGSQRDSDSVDTDGDEESADAVADEGNEEDEDAQDFAVPVFAESPEETAATDFEGPAAAQPEIVASDTVVESVEPEPEEESAVEVPTEAETTDQTAPQDLFASDEGLEQAVRDVLAAITLPDSSEDEKNTERVSDLIVMADHLEHRQGVSHVAFNFLVAEICTALEQGLEAGNPEIAQRWSNYGSRDYVSKMLRGLSEADMFRRAVYSWREGDSGRRRQRRTFNLNRNHELVGRVLIDRLGPSANGTPPVDPIENSGIGDEPDATPVMADQEQQTVEQSALVNGGSEASAVVEAEPAPPVIPEEPAPPAPPDDIEEDYDEPQPRNVRRRPFTSRLLRS